VRASIVERVVAIVGDRPILLTDLRHRGRPFLYRILAGTPNAVQQAAAETEMFRELLNRMIDDRLEEQAADKAHLSVSQEEVDAALRNIATGGKIAVKDLLAEARKQGLSEQDYRDEIRRQVLEGKLVQLRVRGRVRVTEQDARAAYGHLIKQMGEKAPVDIRIIALRLLPGSSAQAIQAREALAQQIVTYAREGQDFCDLVTQYSDDIETRPTCGSRGPQAVTDLVPPVQEALKTMKNGDVANPIRYGTEAVLVVQLVKESKIPTYDDVKEQMAERAYGEAMERQRKQWLLELRRGIYVDVRL
jgi:peptidyl-prolyl cis-trans isomerase SurA